MQIRLDKDSGNRFNMCACFIFSATNFQGFGQILCFTGSDESFRCFILWSGWSSSLSGSWTLKLRTKTHTTQDYTVSQVSVGIIRDFAQPHEIRSKPVSRPTKGIKDKSCHSEAILATPPGAYFKLAKLRLDVRKWGGRNHFTFNGHQEIKAAESLVKSDRNVGCNSAVWYKEPHGKLISESVFNWTNHSSIIAYHKPTSTNQINSRTALGDPVVESNSYGSRLRMTIAADLISWGAAIVLLKDRIKAIEGWCGDHPVRIISEGDDANTRRSRWAKCTLTSSASVSGSHFTQGQAETCRSTKKLESETVCMWSPAEPPSDHLSSMESSGLERTGRVKYKKATKRLRGETGKLGTWVGLTIQIHLSLLTAYGRSKINTPDVFHTGGDI